MEEQAIVDDTKPETAKEALARWDSGGSIWSVEMGGIGPGYEQCIHIVCFELIRDLLDKELPGEDNERELSDFIRKVGHDNKIISNLGLSGAQFGAGMGLAYRALKQGWRAMLDSAPKDRLLLVSKHWPKAEE